MTFTLTKLCLLLACIGHICCRQCDSLITYTPQGRFSFDILKDNDKMAALFDGMPLKRPLVSILLGAASMTAECFGYLAISQWMKAYSPLLSGILVAATVVAFIPGVVHHVFCGTIEWFYVKFGRTEEARQAILEFFQKTLSTMLACFIGLMVFSIVLFVAIVLGWTPLPRWACIFNLVVVFCALAPLRIVGTLNIAGAVMFAGLFFFL